MLERVLKIERRRRLRKPRPLIFFGILILLLAPINYAGMAMKYGIPFYQLPDLFARINYKEWILLVSALLSGTGLLMIRRTGWFIYVISSLVFLGYNVTVFIARPSTLISGAPFQSLLVLSALLYFLRKDIYSPFLSLRQNGWRLYRRYNIAIPMRVDGKEARTMNISAGGALVGWFPNPKREGDSVQVEFQLGGQSYSVEGGITGIHAEGTGIAFRYLPKTGINSLKEELSRLDRQAKNPSGSV